MLTDQNRAQFDADWETLSNGASAQEDATARAQQHREDELRRLAKLDLIAYEPERMPAAKRLNMRAAVLDKLVAERRAGRAATAAQGSALDLHDPDPWPEMVNGASLLDELARTFSRFIVLPTGAAGALALWALFTWVIDAFDTAPRLAIVSAVMRSGKTTLLSILKRLTRRALLASNISPASIFRVLEAAHPTLLIDEADSFARNNEELRGILNSGHTRDAAFVIRTEGDDHEPRRFSTWGAMAIAGIGKLPATWLDRSIVFNQKRKKPAEKVVRLTREHKDGLDYLARKAARWASDYTKKLDAADPAMPDLNSDRAADNWRPLIAIADAAGGSWPDLARQAALALSASREADDEGLGVLLLSDLRDIFDGRNVDRISSGEACAVLASREDRPWAEYRRGSPLSKAGLARLLKSFEVLPKTIRLADGKTAKGYLLSDFDDAFSRHLPDRPLSNRNNVTTQSGVGESDDLETSHDTPRYGLENAGSPYAESECDVVTFKHGAIDAEQELSDEEGEIG